MWRPLDRPSNPFPPGPLCVVLATFLFAGGGGVAWAQSDDCPQATLIGEGIFSGDTSLSTNDGAASCGNSANSPDVWYFFHAAEDCQLQIDTCGSAYDTVLSVHSGCPNGMAIELACNDDTCGLQSFVTIAAEDGTKYLIRVSGFDGASGAYVLNVACSPFATGDACNDAIVIQEGTVVGATTGATNDGQPSCGNSAVTPDVWYVNTPTEDCILQANTCGSTYDTVLSIHTACPGTAANEIACNDDACGLQSSVATNATAGVSYYLRVSGWNGATGDFLLNLQCAPPGQSGADILAGELSNLIQFGREGDTVGCAMASVLCNAGGEPLDWFANPDPRHPFFALNMYRLADGRLEQIGQSWIKHGFGAAQADNCGLGCIPHPDGSRLGVGCSDVYGAGLNADQSIMGPRAELNPWTGAFTFAGSHIDATPPIHDNIQHRLQLRDADIDPAQNPRAVYIVEQYLLAHDDGDHMNSIRHEVVVPSGSPGGTWTFDNSGPNSVLGPAIEAWTALTRTTIPNNPTDDGRTLLAVQVRGNGDGSWHYEYALYNHDMDRGIRTFSIPVDDAITLANIGFSAVPSHDEVFSNDPWQATRSGGTLFWSTGRVLDNPPGNPLRWGALYNFRFDADAGPTNTIATLGLYKPGTPSTLSGPTRGPSPAPSIAGDVNCDAEVNTNDVPSFVLALIDPAAYGASNPDCDIDRANMNGDGLIDGRDIALFLDTVLTP